MAGSGESCRHGGCQMFAGIEKWTIVPIRPRRVSALPDPRPRGGAEWGWEGDGGEGRCRCHTDGDDNPTGCGSGRPQGYRSDIWMRRTEGVDSRNATARHRPVSRRVEFEVVSPARTDGGSAPPYVPRSHRISAAHVWSRAGAPWPGVVPLPPHSSAARRATATAAMRTSPRNRPG